MHAHEKLTKKQPAKLATEALIGTTRKVLKRTVLLVENPKTEDLT